MVFDLGPNFVSVEGLSPDPGLDSDSDSDSDFGPDSASEDDVDEEVEDDVEEDVDEDLRGCRDRDTSVSRYILR